MHLGNRSYLEFCSECIAKVEDPEYQKLTLRLMDDKSVGIAESIGKAELPIKEVLFQHPTSF